MSLEPGGRADKYGNSYENSFLAKLFLRLIREELASVTVEPLGQNSDYVEFISEQRDGHIKFYQCKASNNDHSAWSIADLKKHDVFQRAKAIITDNNKNLYYFISPLPYKQLDELCKRARTNSNPEEFIRYQLTNEPIKKLFSDCIKEFGLDQNNSSDVIKAVYLLSHCYFEQHITGTEAEQDLNTNFGILFTGKASTVRVLLEQYANSTGRYGIKITPNDIINYLESQDIHPRNHQNSDTVLGQIQSLNLTHWDSYHAVHEKFVHRTETDQIIESINNGHSVILHGKAGSGKSGCIEETIDYLKKSGILYLSIKLDKHPPQISADTYGQSLGLPESPVFCLSKLSAGKPCVLILDQLDALRWTNNHSSSALDVCKELFFQARSVNLTFGSSVSILVASRTFDLENDKGLNRLFDLSNSPDNLKWDKISVSLFKTEQIIQIIGEKYNQLSPRLQKLLLTPSSLYVWSKLEESSQKNKISSVFELMGTWWKQIQQACVNNGLTLGNIIACKNKIVMLMENSSIFSLPRVLFPDELSEIDLFISSGLLSNNSASKSISFTHQSFLDYFVTADFLQKIYTGTNLTDLIGERNNQTPLIRYRLLGILQCLIESNLDLFIKQCNLLLEASSVRYYFKCTVFEVIGQCESPSSEILNIIDNYIQKPEWKSYITSVVLYCHPQFIMRLPELAADHFPSDQCLALLRSINRQCPDFVADKLRPFSLQSYDQDCKIFSTLCTDPFDDSDSMFDLRIQILKNNLSLFQHSYVLYSLLDHQSIRSIKIFSILIENWPNEIISKLRLGRPEKLSLYSKQYTWEIITELFPLICNATRNYCLQWSDYYPISDYQDWIENEHDESIVRSIVEIIKHAFAECAQSMSDILIEFIRSIKYPISPVGHECVMHAMLNLPTDYADQVIKWILINTDNKIFVFTADGSNFLSYLSQILQKFSPACSLDLFQKLEQYIVTWKESSTRMIEIFHTRFTARKEHKEYHESAYYAYWGHFQKALLPYMDYSRLSSYSKQLLEVVNRNTWIRLPYFYQGYTISPCKVVISPIEAHSKMVSDQAWLRIISTPTSKMCLHWKISETSSFHLQADHVAFASTIGKQAKQNPMRFIKLALSFPENCYEGYISNILYALYDMAPSDPFDIELVSAVIRRYGHCTSHNISIAISNVIEKNAAKVWPDDILLLLSNIAINHPNPDADQYNVTSNHDPAHKSAESLLYNSINCARGCALHAISALLCKHYNLADQFKDIILSASHDPHPAVRFAVMSCVFPYYNIDPSFATQLFNSLIDSDIRLLYAHTCWDIISLEYSNNCFYYRDILTKACMSEIEDLSEHAAGLLCAVAIYFNDQDALNFLMDYTFNEKQQNSICLQATHSFNSDAYHERSKEILVYLIDHSSAQLYSLHQLFFQNRIVIQRDEAFLIHLLTSNQNESIVHSFLSYLYESDEDICNFAYVLSTIASNLPITQYGDHLTVSELIKCVVRMFDRGKDNPNIREICLNIWDNLFMGNSHVIKPLSDMIDHFE